MKISASEMMELFRAMIPDPELVHDESNPLLPHLKHSEEAHALLQRNCAENVQALEDTVDAMKRDLGDISEWIFAGNIPMPDNMFRVLSRYRKH